MDSLLIDAEASMVVESHRLASFKNWCFDDAVCSSQALASAGFFHAPSRTAPDNCKCFACFKELEGWEPTDDPWQEHRDHDNGCSFVKYGKAQCDLSVAQMMDILISRSVKLFKLQLEAKLSKFALDGAKAKKELMKLADIK